MKGLSFFNKILLIGNVGIAFLLLLACFAPYISLAYFPHLAVVSISVPILLIGNVLFLLYWSLSRKWLFFLPLCVLVIGYIFLDAFIRFNTDKDHNDIDDLSILTYNVHRFRGGDNVVDLIMGQEPDIVCLQEYDYGYNALVKHYKHKFISTEYENLKGRKVQQAIFSKYEIIDAQPLNFPNSYNNAIFADIVIETDTLRIYNVHLQSLKIRFGSIKREAPQRLFERLGNEFLKQELQADLIVDHSERSPYRNIICGDFNNSQYSNVFHEIKRDMKDTFQEKGAGYGRTYDFRFLPLRIDFILGDKHFEVTSHKNFDERLSDHYPVMASFRLKE